MGDCGCPEPSESVKAYFAGILDGEGSIWIGTANASSRSCSCACPRCNDGAVRALAWMLPYLYIKKDQADLGISFRQTLFPLGSKTREERAVLWELRDLARRTLQSMHLRGGNPKPFTKVNPYV